MIGVLPDVDPQDRCVPFGQRAVPSTAAFIHGERCRAPDGDSSRPLLTVRFSPVSLCRSIVALVVGRSRGRADKQGTR
jgi:hypothetical protein